MAQLDARGRREKKWESNKEISENVTKLRKKGGATYIKLNFIKNIFLMVAWTLFYSEVNKNPFGNVH